MSKNSNPRPAAQSNGQTTTPIIAAEYEDRKVTIRRNRNYQETIAAVKRAFASLEPVQNKYIYLCSRFEEFGDVLQVTEELWADLLPQITLVTVILDRRVAAVDSNTAAAIQVSVKISNKQVVSIGILSSATVGQLKERLENKAGVTCDQHSIAYDHEQLRDEDTLVSYNIRDGTLLELMHDIMFLRVKKPVVYLFPPTPLSNIRIDLSLIPDSARRSHGRSMQNQMEPYRITQLAEKSPTYFGKPTTQTSLPSPSCSRPGTPLGVESPSAFDPSRPVVNCQNSVLMPFDKVLSYIDDVLLALGLHTEARTSFITYWLPELQIHSFLALRFVPQDQYEAAAPLTVTPAPQVVTRVFMLFRGVDECEIGQWENGMAMVHKEPSVWKDIIGVDKEKASNLSLFRVLEWGGMEVK